MGDPERSERDAVFDENRRSWNAATRQHNRHKGDQAAFLRGGGSTLFPEEVELLGNVRGKRLLHLQCNAGQDTLSIASQLGAEVTGVDISDEAIAFARRLSEESGIPGTFVHTNIFDWFAAHPDEQTYDVVFASYGAVCWLPDIEGWAKGAAMALKPGGRLVLVEFHPIMGVLDGALSGDWSQASDYMGGRHYAYDDGVFDYVAGLARELPERIVDEAPFVNPIPCHEFSWGIADVVTAVLDAGLRLTTFREYPYSNDYRPFDQLVLLPGDRWGFPSPMPAIPLMYALAATK